MNLILGGSFEIQFLAICYLDFKRKSGNLIDFGIEQFVCIKALNLILGESFEINFLAIF